MKNLLFILFFQLWQAMSLAQATDPMPAECGSTGGPEESSVSSAACTKTSTLWSSNARHIPRSDARTIRVRANFIILQKIDGTGNFQNNAEHMAFLEDWLLKCNDRLGNLTGTSTCSPLVNSAKIEIVPNWIFLPDPDPEEFNWNNDNNPTDIDCPTEINWWLNDLDADINANASIPPGINVYLTVDGSVYNEMVVLGTMNNPQYSTSNPNGMAYFWCSQQPDNANLGRSSRISVANLFLKYWWFQNHYPAVLSEPFTVTRQWLVNEGITLAHEFGHSFISCYVHKFNCPNHLMTQANSERNTLLEDDAGCIHRNLAISNLRRFVDCEETYSPSPLKASSSSTTFDRIVSSNVNELWDIDMRLYSNVTVKTGATLTVSCKLLMPMDGMIKVERGAKLIVEGGTITRANTCSTAQLWSAISVAGNLTRAQPNPSAALASDDAGVAIFKNQGMVEGANIGVTTQRIAGVFEPEYWGGVVDVNDFTFQDCGIGALFAPYRFPNRSQFNKARFTRTAGGASLEGVSIYGTNGIVFEECTFTNMSQHGIRAWDAIITVKQKNKISGSAIGLLASASSPLSGQIQVGVLGLQGNDRNKFENNVVGIRATSNSNVEIFSNDFDNSNFDIAINGTTKSAITDNTFNGSAAGNQFENTGDNKNENLCNTYTGNAVGTNIVGKNAGFLFRQEDFSTLRHDLFIEGLAASPGEIPFFQGSIGSARWNYFSNGKPEQIKTSTVAPYNNSMPFWYFHPDQAIDARLKPKCPLNETCVPQSNFYNFFTGGNNFINCMFPTPPANPPCVTKPCLEAIRLAISQKTALYNQNPSDTLLAELQTLITEREFITDELIRDYRTIDDWTSIESLLNEDMNPANRRRLVGAKLEQRQFETAGVLLQAFPQITAEDQYFVQVQMINTARLGDAEFTLSGEQEATLLAIAEVPSPEAGYAQTLLGILTGRVFMPRLPDLGEERAMKHATSSLLSGFEVSPNPVNDLMIVHIPFATNLQTLELLTLTTGSLVQSLKVAGQEVLSLTARQLPNGMYLLVLREQGAVVGHVKVIVQH